MSRSFAARPPRRAVFFCPQPDDGMSDRGGCAPRSVHAGNGMFAKRLVDSRQCSCDPAAAGAVMGSQGMFMPLEKPALVDSGGSVVSAMAALPRQEEPSGGWCAGNHRVLRQRPHRPGRNSILKEGSVRRGNVCVTGHLAAHSPAFFRARGAAALTRRLARWTGIVGQRWPACLPLECFHDRNHR